MKKRLKRLALIVAVLLVVIAGVAYVVMQQASFGKTPTGQRLARVKQSPNYRDGSFQNLSHTTTFTGQSGFLGAMKESTFGRSPQNKPPVALPSQKHDLKAIAKTEDVLVWFGHSSYFMQVDGKTLLVDPVMSGAASPFSFMVKAFPGADAYTADDLPAIDFLFISHDHWDHLDYETIIKLKPKIGKIITGLGTGEHLERWGFAPDQILEGDWFDAFDLGDGFGVHITPSRHFAGRSLVRNQAIWASFVLKTPSMRLFLGGDSGYDTHFAEIGRQFGPFDLALLECGQYNQNWSNIHMMPEQTAQAALDLGAARLMPVHWAKFALALHAWDESIRRVSKAAADHQLPLVTPMIGQIVPLRDTSMAFPAWWETVK